MVNIIGKKLSQKKSPGYNTEKYSDNEIILGLKNSDDSMIRYIYHKYFKGIQALVFSFHNLTLIPDDIFQEGLTRAIINIKQDRFKGESSFYTYFSAICKNVCRKELQKSSKMVLQEEQTEQAEVINEGHNEILPVMLEMKEKLDSICRELIDLRFRIKEPSESQGNSGSHGNMKFEAIARILNIEPDNARQKFRRCMEKLKEMLKSEPSWKEYWELA